MLTYLASIFAPSSIGFRQPRIFPSTKMEAPHSRSPKSFYEVLGVPMGSSSQEIKDAYRKLARICHPDVAIADEKAVSVEELMRIHAAYSVLSDVEKRADYDRRIFRPHRISGSYSVTCISTSGDTTCRNWETDQCW
ncbi:chaperone protein dnaJ 11, chloroplastic-like [Olea europaea var. sylvestris]|uniref:chaperone protein dnaJ 11, chloroplastic-like n=1 Tax=Olea europaea var. sylvestris TaxID=158386 RepID=UPI000C1CD9C5|nr:chaperone protein dnaJ 11, chloroplastic-like [Olea europaea var. sylvestris]